MIVPLMQGVLAFDLGTIIRKFGNMRFMTSMYIWSFYYLDLDNFDYNAETNR